MFASEFINKTDEKKDLPLLDPAKQVKPDYDQLKNYVREEYNGYEYIPINVVELTNLLDLSPEEALGNKYLMQGIVHRAESLEKRGLFGVYRLSMVCCIADAVAFAIKVKNNGSHDFSSGQWVKIYGSLVELEKNARSKHVETKGASLYVNEGYILNPDKLEKIPEPKEPYVTEWNFKEPFVY